MVALVRPAVLAERPRRGLAARLALAVAELDLEVHQDRPEAAGVATCSARAAGWPVASGARGREKPSARSGPTSRTGRRRASRTRSARLSVWACPARTRSREGPAPA